MAGSQPAPASLPAFPCFPKTALRGPRSEPANPNSLAGLSELPGRGACGTHRTRTGCALRHLCRGWQRCRGYPTLSSPNSADDPFRRRSSWEGRRTGGPYPSSRSLRPSRFRHHTTFAVTASDAEGFGRNLPGACTPIPGAMPLPEELGPRVNHAPASLSYLFAAKGAFHSMSSISDRGLPPVAIIAKPPHLRAGIRRYIPGAQIAVLGWMPFLAAWICPKPRGGWTSSMKAGIG